jgi:hypothetical protein
MTIGAVIIVLLAIIALSSMRRTHYAKMPEAVKAEKHAAKVNTGGAILLAIGVLWLLAHLAEKLPG